MAAPYYPNQGPPPIPPQWPPQPPTWQQRPPPTQLQPQFQYSRPPPPPPPPPPPLPPSGQYYATNSVSPPPVSGPSLASFGPMSSIYGQQAQPAPVAQQQGWTGGEWGTGASGSANGGAYSGGTFAAGPHGGQPLGRQLSVSHQPGAVPFSSGGSSAELWFSNSAGSPPPEHAPPQTQHQPEPRSDRPHFSHFLNTTLPDVRFEGKEIESPTYERILPRHAVAPFPFEFPPLEPAFVPPAIVEEEEEEEEQYRIESPFVRSDEAPTPPLLVASPPIMTPPSSSTTPSFEIHSPVSPQRTESLFSVADPYHPTSQSPLQYNQSLHNSNRQSLEIPDHRRSLPQPPTLQDAPPPPPPTSPTPPTASYDLVPTPADQPYPASPEPTPPAVPDDTVYFYTLRCAMLADILSVQPPAPPPPHPTESAVSTPIHHSTSYGLSSPLLSRHSSSSSTSTTLSSLRRLKESGKDAWAKSLDKVKEVRGVDGGSSSLHFPSSALKALETRLQRIAANAVPLYPDRDFQASVGDFQDKLVAEPFRTSFKKEGTVEELLLVFGRTAQTTLRGRHQGHEWVELLDAHMAMFAGVVRDVLKTQGVSGEIITRLDAHASRLGTAPPTLEKTPSRSSRASSISSHRKSAEFEVVSYPETGTMLDLRDMRLVQVVGRMFGQTEADLAHDVDSLRHICTEKAAYLDLRHLVNNIAKGAEFPARREDFDSDSSFQQWRKDENHELSSLLVEMLSRHPSLREADGDVSALVFVPPQPKPTYARLVDFALKASSRDDEVLSSDYEELLDVCVTRWRLTTPARVNSLLAAAVDPDVSMEFVYYALDELDAATGTWDYDRWPWAERQALFNSLQSLFDILLPRLARIFQGALQLPFAAVVDPLERIYSNQVYAEDARELAEVFVSLKGSIVWLVERAYVAKRDAIHASIPEAAPPEEALEPLFQLLQHLMEESKRYTKEFRTQLFGNIDVPALFIGVAAPLFVKDLEGAQETLAAIASRAQGAPPDDDILDLYKNTVKLQKMHDSYCRENPLVIPYSALFGAYVKRWISATADTMTKVWVARAIENDKFELDDGSPQLFSTSVGDIIDGCKGAIKTLQDFAWPDEVESAQFATKISQAIANAIQQYSISLEQLFMAEVFPQTGAAEEEESWFKKAALAVKGGNKVDRFVFQVKSLVKLNNIEEARRLLDTMSLSLNAEAVGAVLDKHPLPTSPEGARWLFTIKVVSGEKLVAPDGSRGTLESFVALHDLAGYQISRTRTVQDSNDPRWEQSFDIMLRNELMVQATVYSRITGKDAEIGRARFHLDPSEFQPLVRRDLLLPLEGAHGPSKILVRIRMEPETDDPRFYFGRAFRSLKRTEKEMARVIVSKVLPVVRSYLSMATLRTLLGTNVSNLIDSQMLLDKTRTNLTIAASSAATSGTRAALALTARMNALLEGTPEQLIPDVIDRHDVPPAPEAATRPGPPTPREVQQQAIAPLEPLVDYLNDTMRTLFTTLSTAAWMKFSERLWYEILATIEDLVLPPLSDQPSNKKPLTERELDVVFRWLHFMVEFLHENGDGMEMSALHNAKYGELMMAHLYYEMDSDELQIEVIRSMQRQLSTSPTLLGRSKSVYAHSNLGTIKKTKSEKRRELDGITGPLILRILRMRPGLEEFIKHQVGLLNLPPPGTEAHRRALAGREMPGGRRAAAAANRGQGQGAGMRAGGLAAIPDGVE